MIATENIRACNICKALIHSGAGFVGHMSWHENQIRLMRAAIADAVKEALNND